MYKLQLIILFLFALGVHGDVVSQRLLTVRQAIDDGFYDIAQSNLNLCVQEDLGDKDRIDALSMQMELLYKQEKYASIDQLLADNMDLLSTNTYACFLRASSLYKQGKFKESIDYINGLADGLKNSDIREVLAWDYVELSDFSKALDIYEDIISLSDTNSDKIVFMNYGKLLYKLEKYDRAVDVLNVLKGTKQPKYQEGLLLLAGALHRLGETASAAGELQAIIDSEDYLSGVRSSAAYALGDIYAETPNMHTNAVLAYLNGVALTDLPDVKAQGEFKIANLNLATELNAGSIEALRTVIRKYPQSEYAAVSQLNLATVLFEEALYEESLLEYQKFLESFDHSELYAKVYAGMALTLNKLGRYAEAATAYRRASEMSDDPIDQAFYRYKEADERFNNEQYVIAQGLYSNLVVDFPDSELVYQASYQVAESLSRQGKNEEAIAALLDLQDKCDYKNIEEKIWLELPQLYIKNGDFQEAIQAYTAAIDAKLSDELTVNSYIGRGELFYRLFEFASALNDFETVVDMFSDSPYIEKALYMICIVNYWLGNDDISLGKSEDFLKKYPESEYAGKLKFWMGKLYFNIEDFKKAKTIFLECASENPNADSAPIALLQAGRSAVRLQKYSDAISIFSRLITQYPDSYVVPYAYFAQADALTELAEYSEAIVLFDEIINKYPDSELKYAAIGRKGDCNMIIGIDDPDRYTTSIECYEEISENDKVPPELAFQAAYKIGKTYEKQKRMNEALRQYYENVVLRYHNDLEKGKVYGDDVKEWVVLAGIAGADILERLESWKKVVSILQRVQDLNDDYAEDIEHRIKDIKKKYWWVFY